MTKRKKLVKQALKNPELYTDAELQFMRKWLYYKKQHKQAKAATKETPDQ